jgi:6-phosphogluconolactonase/glucosamine-6-phosphate isomerase/deaminase
MNHEFRLVYKLPDDDIDQVVDRWCVLSEDAFAALHDRLYEAGCDDALIGTGRDGHIAFLFDREAPSRKEAIASAMAAIESVMPEATFCPEIAIEPYRRLSLKEPLTIASAELLDQERGEN